MNPQSVFIENDQSLGAPGRIQRIVPICKRISNLALSLAVAAAFFLLVRSTPDIPGGDDGYRHVKFASRLAQDPRATLADPWKLAYLWPRPVDAWFGYHLLLAPFTLTGNLITAAKALASLIYGALAFVILTILEDMRVYRRPAWLVLAMTGSGMALYRSTLTRPYLFSILLLIVVTHFTLRGKSAGVAAASAAHALSYSMFFAVALAPAIYLIIRRDRLALKLATACALGILAGLLCNPYFPENLRFDLAQAFTPLSLKVPMTMELLPLNMEWVNPSRPILGVWLVAVLRTIWLWTKQKPSSSTLLLLGMSLAAFVGSLRVARTFDYFVPLAVLSSAAVISPWILESRRNLVDAAAVATVLLVLCGLNVAAVHRVLVKTPSANRFRGASEYLLANGRGALVFNTQWEQYPFLFFWNSRNTYITGIDPSLMLRQDPRRYWLWRHVSDDADFTCDIPKCAGDDLKSVPDTVIEDFGAPFLVLEHDKNPHLEAMLGKDLSSREVYRDDFCSVFALRTHLSLGPPPVFGSTTPGRGRPS